MSIPAFVNPGAGTAAPVLEALRRDPAFAPRLLDGPEIGPALQRAIAGGVRRVVVSGGDGTVAAAAALLAGTGVKLAVVPAGTLNHFARDHGIPTDAGEAVRLAATGAARPDAAPHGGGRSLTPPELGGRAPGGARALDVIVPRGFRRAHRLLRADAGTRGGAGTATSEATSEAGVDRLLVDRCRVELGRPRVPVAVDREITTLAPPLECRRAPDRLPVVSLKGR